MRLLGRFLGSASATPATEIDVTAAQSLHLQGAQLVDVREPGEFRDGHAQGARNIPLGQLVSSTVWSVAISPMRLLCRSGNRSRMAQDLLRRHNIADTRNVRGGMLAWRRASLPLQ
jgi:rhodanese-related sulfurtransferase